MASSFTVRQPDRVKRLCLMNTVTGYGAVGRDDLPQINTSRWFRWIGEGLETGRSEAVLTNLGSTVVDVMKIIGFDSAVVDDVWIRAYSAPSAPEECKGALEFPLDAYHGRVVEYMVDGFGGVDALRSKPAMLAEGMRDHAIFPENAIADFRGIWSDGPVVELPRAGHFCQEDAPDTIVALIQQFLQMT